jgi:hypothetical protein
MAMTRLFATLTTLLLLGCGGSDETESIPATAAGAALGVPRLRAVTYEVGAATGVSVATRVLVNGETVADSIADAVARVPECTTSVVDTTIVRTVDGGVPGAFVWLEGIARGPRDTMPRRVTLMVDNCQLQPRTAILPVGGTLMLWSRDSLPDTLIVASVHGWRDTIPFSHPGQVVPIAGRATEQGMLSVQSVRRPWLRAIVAVTPTPYWRITDSTGAAVFTDVPIGAEVVARAWHPGVRGARTPLTVRAGAAITTLKLTR